MTTIPQRLQIRPAAIDDVRAIARVHVDVWRTTYSGIVPQPYLDSLSYEKREEAWRKNLSANRSGYHFLVAETPSRDIVGFSDGGPNRDEHLPFDGEVYAIYLRREFQSRGWGRWLFEASLRRLAEDGFSKAVVWVLEANPTTGFYAKMGGVVVGTKWIEIGGKQLSELAYGFSTAPPRCGNSG